MFGKTKWDALESALSDVSVDGNVRGPLKTFEDIDGNGNNNVVKTYHNGFTDGVGNAKREKRHKDEKPQSKKSEKTAEELKVSQKTASSKPDPRPQSFNSWEAEHGYHSTNDGFNIYSDEL